MDFGKRPASEPRNTGLLSPLRPVQTNERPLGQGGSHFLFLLLCTDFFRISCRITVPTTSYSIPPASHFSLRAKQSLLPSAAAPVTLVILESLLRLALSVARSRVLTELLLSRISPFTLHLGRRGKPTSTTPDVALEEHVTAAREDTPPPPPVGGATLCACGLGGGGVELRRVDRWCTLPRGRGNSRLGSRGHVIRRLSVPPGRQRASRDQPTECARRLRVLGQLAAGRGAAAPQKRVSLWTTAVLLVEPLTSHCQQSSCLSLQLLELWM